MQIKPDKRPYASTKVNKRVIDAILSEIEKGGTRRHSSESNGITDRHFQYLLQQGKCDLEHSNNDTLCAYLVLRLRKIELTEIQECRKAIKELKKGHKGAQWTLEHVYWQDFGSNAEVKELADEIEKLKSLHGANGNGEINSLKTEEDT
jgi:hypothetical protein